MEPEEKDLLKKILALGEENNDILRSMKRSIRIGHAMSFVYWIFIIGSAIGAYYLIQPYIDQIQGAYGGAKNTFGDFSGTIKNLKQQFGQ